jgi:hypothetical protein
MKKQNTTLLTLTLTMALCAGVVRAGDISNPTGPTPPPPPPSQPTASVSVTDTKLMADVLSQISLWLVRLGR